MPNMLASETVWNPDGVRLPVNRRCARKGDIPDAIPPIL